MQEKELQQRLETVEMALLLLLYDKSIGHMPDHVITACKRGIAGEILAEMKGSYFQSRFLGDSFDDVVKKHIEKRG